MKQRLIKLLVVLVVVVAAIVVWNKLSQPPNPVYQGRQLSAWLHDFTWTGSSSPKEQAQASARATEAVRNIGTNALPMLLAMLQAHDSTLQNNLINLARMQSLIPVNHVTAEDRHQEAGAGYEALASAASNAVPDLMKIFSLSTDLKTRGVAVSSLGHIGPPASEAVPLLLTTVTNARPFVREAAISALGNIHAQPAIVVPVLIKLAQDRDLLISLDAAIALGNFGSNASPAIPLLTERFNRVPDATTKEELRKIIAKIDPEAAAKTVVK